MSDRRAAERIEIVTAVECSVEGRRELATAYDVSTDGCLLQASLGLFNEGDRVRLRFGRGPIAEGRVMWTRHRNAGVQFAVALTPAAVSAIVRRSVQWPRATARFPRAAALVTAGAVLAPPARLGYRLYYAWSVAVLAGCAAALLHR